VADCFGTVAYADGCAMALSDGVSWGAKPRLAARRAVYAALRGMHGIWTQLVGQTVGSRDVLQRMLQVGAAGVAAAARRGVGAGDVWGRRYRGAARCRVGLVA
jgi:hypothetical protein